MTFGGGFLAWSIQNKTAKVVQGILLPAAWDKNGGVLGFLLAAFDDQNYHLESKEHSAQWHKYLTLPVSVKGTIHRSGGQKRIMVHTLDPL
jgi:hypothetical protein